MNGPSPEDVAEALRWLAEADDELIVVDVLTADGRAPARVACFHAHLAAEKALKALIIFRSVPVPKSHDLARLLQLIPPTDAERFVRSDLADLNPWTVEGRYPADLTEPSAADLSRLAVAAERAVVAVRAAMTD